MLDDVTQRRDGVGLVPRSSAPGQCRFDSVVGSDGHFVSAGQEQQEGRSYS